MTNQEIKLQDIIKIEDKRLIRYTLQLITNNKCFDFNDDLDNYNIYDKSLNDSLKINIYDFKSNISGKKYIEYKYGNDEYYLYTQIINIIIFYINRFEKNKKEKMIEIIKNKIMITENNIYFINDIFEEIMNLNLNLKIRIDYYETYDEDNKLYYNETILINCKNNNSNNILNNSNDILNDININNKKYNELNEKYNKLKEKYEEILKNNIELKKRNKKLLDENNNNKDFYNEYEILKNNYENLLNKFNLLLSIVK